MTPYLRQFALITLLLVALVAGLNVAVDPYAVWHNRCVEGVNCNKTEAGGKIYLTKAEQWQYLNPRTVIVGNSRPELGLNPQSPLFAGRDVYNLALRGAGVATQLTYLVNLLDHHQPEQVILNLDFLDFLQSPGRTIQWPPSHLNYRALPLSLLGERRSPNLFADLTERLRALLTLDTLLASVKTLANQRAQTNFTTRQGFNQGAGFIPVVNHEGTPALFDQKQRELTQRLRGKTYTLFDPNGESNSFKALIYVTDQLRQRGIRLDLFISPYHRHYLDVIQRTGHFDLYQQWKQQLVRQLEDIDFFESNTLLDFSGFNRYTTEPVPKRKGVFMNWYWEPAHYRAELGEVIISHILSANDEFALTPQNLSQRLLAERNAMNQPTLTQNH